MMFSIKPWILLLLIFTNCTPSGSRQPDAKIKPVYRDTSISKSVSYSDLFLDSLDLEGYIKANRLDENTSTLLRNFYNSRNYQFAWFSEKGAEQQTRAFWNLHNNFIRYSQDSSSLYRLLHQQVDSVLEIEQTPPVEADSVLLLELQLTQHFFNYAKTAFTGRIDPEELQWHIPRKKINATALLDSLINNKGDSLASWEPLNPQYRLMREELIRLYAMEQAGGWPKVQPTKTLYKPGDSGLVIHQVKEILRITGDYGTKDTSWVYHKDFQVAVVRAQKRFGLPEDGVIGETLMNKLNVPVDQRIQQLLLNMERMRWTPPRPDGSWILVNIPDFKLHVYEDAKVLFSMNVVVGKAANKTVIFNDQLKHVVFSPYWNVPRSIVRNEIYPAMKRNPGYLRRNNMEQTGTSGGLPVIRQKPGPANALGKVKFIFPNSFNIYFHDTPSKSLFDRSRRAFSHGCIRLAEPKKLATYLLRDNKDWNDQRITAAMNAGKERWVPVKDSVAVMITYFTAWVDADGLLNFRDDIYGHDAELASKMFEKN